MFPWIGGEATRSATDVRATLKQSPLLLRQRKPSLPPIPGHIVEPLSPSGDESGGGETSGYASDSADFITTETPIHHPGYTLRRTPESFSSGSGGREERAKWGERGVGVGHLWSPTVHLPGTLLPQIEQTPPSWIQRGLQQPAEVLVISHDSSPPSELSNRPSLSRSSEFLATSENNQRCFLRGRNAPVDPIAAAEKDRKRQKAIEHQNAIKQQLEEKERKKMEERERRAEEERREDERLRRDRELELHRLEEERRTQREKEQNNERVAKALMEALEIAEKRAKEEKAKARRKHVAHQEVLVSELVGSSCRGSNNSSLSQEPKSRATVSPSRECEIILYHSEVTVDSPPTTMSPSIRRSPGLVNVKPIQTLPKSPQPRLSSIISTLPDEPPKSISVQPLEKRNATVSPIVNDTEEALPVQKPPHQEPEAPTAEKSQDKEIVSEAGNRNKIDLVHRGVSPLNLPSLTSSSTSRNVCLHSPDTTTVIPPSAFVNVAKVPAVREEPPKTPIAAFPLRSSELDEFLTSSVRNFSLEDLEEVDTSRLGIVPSPTPARLLTPSVLRGRRHCKLEVSTQTETRSSRLSKRAPRLEDRPKWGVNKPSTRFIKASDRYPWNRNKNNDTDDSRSPSPSIHQKSTYSNFLPMARFRNSSVESTKPRKISVAINTPRIVQIVPQVGIVKKTSAKRRYLALKGAPNILSAPTNSSMFAKRWDLSELVTVKDVLSQLTSLKYGLKMKQKEWDLSRCQTPFSDTAPAKAPDLHLSSTS